MSGLLQDREPFESIVAMISVASGRISRIRLLPVDLNFESKNGNRGRPRLASPEAGKQIIRVVEKKSKRFKTQIVYDPGENVGEAILN